MTYFTARFTLSPIVRFLLILTFMSVTTAVQAKDTVSIEEAWVRPTSAGQMVGAAYMTFNSNQDITLIRATSDVTDHIEIHSMSMKNGVMKMRMLENLMIKAGKPYRLEPGGFHLMLFNLKKPLIAGGYVSFEFVFKSGTTEFKQFIKAPIQASSDGESDDHSHHHH